MRSCANLGALIAIVCHNPLIGWLNRVNTISHNQIRVDMIRWPGRERKLDGRQEAHLIAFACSAAPAGHTHWTLQLLADQVVELEFAESISLETVRQILKKTNSSPGRRKSGVSPR